MTILVPRTRAGWSTRGWDGWPGTVPEGAMSHAMHHVGPPFLLQLDAVEIMGMGAVLILVEEAGACIWTG